MQHKTNILILVLIITQLFSSNFAVASHNIANASVRPPAVIFIKFNNEKSGTQPSQTYICSTYCLLTEYYTQQAEVRCDPSGTMEEYAQGWTVDLHGNIIYVYNDAYCQMAVTTVTDMQAGTHYVGISGAISNINWFITSEGKPVCGYADSIIYLGVIDSGKWEELDQVADFSSNCGNPPDIDSSGYTFSSTTYTRYGQATQGDQLTAVLEWYVDAYKQYSFVALCKATCSFVAAEGMISYLYVSGYR